MVNFNEKNNSKNIKHTDSRFVTTENKNITFKLKLQKDGMMESISTVTQMENRQDGHLDNGSM